MPVFGPASTASATAGPDVVQFINAQGAETTLQVLKGVSGRFFTPIDFVEQQVPQAPGARLREVRHMPREVALPVIIESNSFTGIRQELRALAAALRPELGNGRLRNVAPDGTVRELTCRYAEGLGLTEDANTSGHHWRKTVLVFRAVDPYWYDLDDTTSTYHISAPTTANWFPIFPLTLGSSEVFTTPTLFNPGDAEAYPRWRFMGPMSGLTLTNLTTGDRLVLARTLVISEVLYIDTHPDRLTVTSESGENLFSLLTDDSVLWSLLPGANDVSIAMAGATADSSVTVAYRVGYQTP